MYLLDTNIYIFLIKNKNPYLKKKIFKCKKEDTETYGMIRAYLENRGIPVEPFDTQIAAQALTRNLTVVTNNIREFSSTPELKVEDWTKE